MTAYEIADIVDKWAYSESAEYLTDAANLLRQQANRIAELEKENSNLKYEISSNAWGKSGQLIPCNTTPQTKPLSDEEIQKTWESLFENEDDIVHIHNFARAIEAKVRGEK